jgi:DNA-directed RNA polymerase subunit H
MHVLQSKHSRLKLEEAEELLKKLNLSRAQLPKIKITDAALPEGAQVGEVIKIERADCNQKKEYFRIVV